MRDDSSTITYRAAFVTSHWITAENVAALVEAGRCRYDSDSNSCAVTAIPTIELSHYPPNDRHQGGPILIFGDIVRTAAPQSRHLDKLGHHMVPGSVPAQEARSSSDISRDPASRVDPRAGTFEVTIRS